MRLIGIITTIFSIAALLFVLNIDTSVATSSGERVNNIGLMSQKNNLIIVSGIFFLAGVIILGFSLAFAQRSAAETHACPFCAEKIKKQANICKHCGKEQTPEKSSEQTKTLAQAHSIANDSDFQNALSTLKQYGPSAEQELRLLHEKTGDVIPLKRLAEIISSKHLNEAP